MAQLTPKAEQPKKDAGTTADKAAEKREWVTPEIQVISVNGGPLIFGHESHTYPPFHSRGTIS